MKTLPPPDPTTRVDVDFDIDASAPSSSGVDGRRTGELIVAAGLGGILVSVCSAFAKFLDLPSLSEKSVAGLGAILVLVGAMKVRATKSASSVVVGEIEEGPSISVDLPSLTGELSGTLAQLRQEHGMAYRTRTWIEDVLPAYGKPLTDPALARDLLAAAALDAGGIRADLAGIAETHSPRRDRRHRNCAARGVTKRTRGVRRIWPSVATSVGSIIVAGVDVGDVDHRRLALHHHRLGIGFGRPASAFAPEAAAGWGTGPA